MAGAFDYVVRRWFLISPFGFFSLMCVLFAFPPFPRFSVPWINLLLQAFTFLHQFEEYVWPGGFPDLLAGILLRKPYLSDLDWFLVFFVNIPLVWAVHLVSCFVSPLDHPFIALFPSSLALVNVVGHLLVFNIARRTIYNAGMVTAVFFFLPASVWGILSVYRLTGMTAGSLVLRVVVGVVVGFVLINVPFRLSAWLCAKESPKVPKEQQKL